jgi:hypothetical protein
VLTVLLFTPAFAGAYTIEDLNLGPRGDFVLEPGKTEVVLKPGESIVKNIAITSRIEGVSHFSISTEDFRGSEDPGNAVVLMGNDPGPYSLRDYLTPEIDDFTLELGEKITIPVQISIPMDAEPGGIYGAAIIQSDPRAIDGGGQAKVISRLGSLFLVRIEGDIKEEGDVEDFRITTPHRFFHEKGPITFEVLFRNSGSVHLVPYGVIEIKNTLGTVVAELPVDAYFALPDSLRFREIEWNKETLLGRYTATLTLQPGYGEESIVREVAFWVMPWKVLLGGFVGVFVLVYLFYFIATRFEFKRKEKD